MPGRAPQDAKICSRPVAAADSGTSSGIHARGDSVQDQRCGWAFVNAMGQPAIPIIHDFDAQRVTICLWSF